MNRKHHPFSSSNFVGLGHFVSQLPTSLMPVSASLGLLIDPRLPATDLLRSNLNDDQVQQNFRLETKTSHKIQFDSTELNYENLPGFRPLPWSSKSNKLIGTLHSCKDFFKTASVFMTPSTFCRAVTTSNTQLISLVVVWT